MRRLPRFSSFLASISLAVGVLAATMAMAGDSQGVGAFCGPPFLNNAFNPPAWDCTAPANCVYPKYCYPVTVEINGELYIQCQCL